MVKLTLPRPIWRLMRIPKFWYRIGLGPLVGRIFLLLKTKGRKTGKKHTVPLQYTQDEQVYYVGSARGTEADWIQNILVDPTVEVQVKHRRFVGEVEIISEENRVLEYLQLQMKKHPILMKLILRLRGFKTSPTLGELKQYAAAVTLICIRPTHELN